MAKKRIKETKHYTFPELLLQSNRVAKTYPILSKSLNNGKLQITLKLKPTESSIDYTVKIVAKLNKKSVDIFVINPRINRKDGNTTVPHMYSDNSLCLYYPEYKEWSYTDLWSETLIPWTSLWLYYYEVWKETGEWLGGGIHGKKHIPMAQ